jgi:hypothetical protein
MKDTSDGAKTLTILILCNAAVVFKAEAGATANIRAFVYGLINWIPVIERFRAACSCRWIGMIK